MIKISQTSGILFGTLKVITWIIAGYCCSEKNLSREKICSYISGRWVANYMG